MHGSFVAVGTACAISCMVLPVPQFAFPTSPREGMNNATPINMVSNKQEEPSTMINKNTADCSSVGSRWACGAEPARGTSQQAAAIRLHRCWRSCVGLATPRVAANASESSSGVK